MNYCVVQVDISSNVFLENCGREQLPRRYIYTPQQYVVIKHHNTYLCIYKTVHFSRPAVLLEYKYIIYIIKYYEYYKYYDAYIYAYNVHHNNNSVISVYFPIQNQCGCITLTASVFRLFSPLWRRLAIDGFEAPRTWSWPLRPCLRPLHRSWWTPIHIIIASSLLTNKRDAVPTPVDACVCWIFLRVIIGAAKKIDEEVATRIICDVTTYTWYIIYTTYHSL